MEPQGLAVSRMAVPESEQRALGASGFLENFSDPNPGSRHLTMSRRRSETASTTYLSLTPHLF